jgi:hypothetical protein
MQCPKERQSPYILEIAKLLERLVRITRAHQREFQLASFVMNNQCLKHFSEYFIYIYTSNLRLYLLMSLIPAP